MKRLVVLCIALLVVILLLPTAVAGANGKPSPGAKGKPSPEAKFDRTLDRIYAQGYPQRLQEYFVSLGTNPDWGFRWAGTSAEKTMAKRVLKEFRAAGLNNVRLEKVPVDVFEFKHASVTAGSHFFQASSFAGTPPTGPLGITADVIYVGNGTKEAFDAAEAAYGPVEGKLVLMDLEFDVAFWMSLPGAEAAHRGALGVITTYGDGGYYWYSEDSLGSFDATYNYDWAPMVYVAKQDGDVLRAEVQAANDAGEPYEATMICDTDVTLADDGGYGYNVVGTLRGSSRSGEQTIISGHLDAHFTGAMDDTAAVTNMIAVARAMRQSGYRPVNDVVFLATCGEEFGYTNSYYDWLAGSWYAATQEHPDWAGKTRGFIGLELMGLEGAPLGSATSEELVAMLNGVASQNPQLVPYGTSFNSPVYCWNDQWPFAAEGIPGIRFGTSNALYRSLYHTQYDNMDLISYDYLAKIAKFIFRTQRALDTGLLPYDFDKRADTLSASVDGDELLEAGADPAAVARLVDGVDAFADAAATYMAAADAGDVAGTKAVNKKLLAAVTQIHDDFTALDAWDLTRYPHQQLLWDTQLLNASIAALQDDPVDPDAAAGPLWDVGQMYYGLMFSYEAFVQDQARHDPSHPRINWGAQGQLAPYLDLVAEYDMIYDGEYAAALASLTSVRDSELVLLNERLAQMADTLDDVTPLITSLVK